jgi:hypothetical protein
MHAESLARRPSNPSAPHMCPIARSNQGLIPDHCCCLWNLRRQKKCLRNVNREAACGVLHDYGRICADDSIQRSAESVVQRQQLSDDDGAAVQCSSADTHATCANYVTQARKIREKNKRRILRQFRFQHPRNTWAAVRHPSLGPRPTALGHAPRPATHLASGALPIELAALTQAGQPHVQVQVCFTHGTVSGVAPSAGPAGHSYHMAGLPDNSNGKHHEACGVALPLLGATDSSVLAGGPRPCESVLEWPARQPRVVHFTRLHNQSPHHKKHAYTSHVPECGPRTCSQKYDAAPCQAQRRNACTGMLPGHDLMGKTPE